MHFYLKSRSLWLLLAASIAGLQGMSAQTLTMVSGNGQLVGEQFLIGAPLVVQAKDAMGRPAPGVAITWTVPQNGGTLESPAAMTDANGLATSGFLSTSLQPFQSFASTTVTASSAFGNVGFIVTTFLTNGAAGAQPAIELVTPTLDNRTITGTSGSIIPGAVVVRVSAGSGVSQGLPIPNVGVRIANNQDPTLPPPAACNSPGGVVLTNAQGLATCDLAITGPPGTTQLITVVGEFQNTRFFSLQVTPGSSCPFTIAPTSMSFGANGGSGTVSVTAPSGCFYTATSNANWITITSGSSGTGNGTVGYSVAPNTSAARIGTLLIAGQTFTVNQAVGSAPPGPLAITTSSLPDGLVGVPYSSAVVATGGAPPYTFTVSGTFPSGLTLKSSTGAISGTPTIAGLYGFVIKVTDSASATVSQNFSVNISSQGPTSFKITNVSLQGGVIGQPYQQLVQAAGGCLTPFTAVTISVFTGSLPPGLALTQGADGLFSITGTPTVAGSFQLTLRAVAGCGDVAFGNYTITITGGAPPPPPLAASPTSISFTLVQSNNPPPAQTIMVSANGQAIAYAATISAGANFLTINSGANGTTPGTVSIGLIPSSNNLPPNVYNGGVTITPNNGGTPVVVQVILTVTAPAAPTLSVSPINLAFASPGPTGLQTFQQTIAVGSSGASIHYTVSVTSTGGGWLMASPPSGDTPGTVTVSVNAASLPAGSYTGLVTITPTAGSPLNVAVTLNVTALMPSILSVTNGASFIPGAVAPGEIVTIFGTSIGPATLTPLALDASGLISTNLASARVYFDDIPSPLIYTSAKQVSAIVPYEVAGRASVRVQVEYQGVRSTAVVVNVVDTNPGIFVVDASGQGAILNQNFSVNSAANGADSGSVVSIFATGEGQTNPPGTTGKITGNVLAKPLLGVSVQIDGLTADVFYAGNAPGLPAGALQVNAKVPAGVRRGVSVPVVVTVGNASSQGGVTLYVNP